MDLMTCYMDFKRARVIVDACSEEFSDVANSQTVLKPSNDFNLLYHVQRFGVPIYMKK